MTEQAQAAGRALDAEVAEFMGWERSVVSNFPWQLIPPGEDWCVVRLVPHYSTDPAAAWLVVEYVAGTRCFVSVYNTPDDTWCAAIGAIEPIEAATAPLAICLALRAYTELCASPVSERL